MARTDSVARNDSGLPWATDTSENQRFYLALALMFVLFLPPALFIPTIILPEPDRSEIEKIPPQLARLIEQKKAPEPVVPIKPEPVSEPKAEPQAEKPEPVEKTAPAIVKTPKRTQPKPEQTVEQARETASRTGLIAMKETLSSMRSSEPVTTKTLSANVESSDLISSQTSEDPVRWALADSGGVEHEQGPTRDVAVADHQVRKVDSAQEPSVAKALPQKAASSGSGTRAMSNIRKVFEANKTALNSLYRRELRKDPTLEGRVTLKLVIEPDGSVSKCDVVESELEHSSLEQRIAMRVRLFNFGSSNVEQRELTFPLDFLPG